MRYLFLALAITFSSTSFAQQILICARDFAADEPVILMSLEEEGAYRRLLDHQWSHGSIPDDMKQLAAICKGASVARMKSIWAAVSPCFMPADEPGRLVNQRLERVRQEAERFRAEDIARGAAMDDDRAYAETCRMGGGR